MKSLLARFVKDESGATAIEYGLIAGLISIAIVTILPVLGNNLEQIFSKINNALAAANQ